MRTRKNVSLERLTTFRIGGQPRFYVRPRDYEELEAALLVCRSRGVTYRVLGGGSNLLVNDGALPFAVIHVCSPGFDWIEQSDERTLRVGAGVRLARLLAHCERAGLGGLEFLSGVPGTVGGALIGNAGAWGHSIGERVRRLWQVGDVKGKTEAAAQSAQFAYRTSGLAGTIVTEVQVEVEPRSPELIGRLSQRYAAEKSKRHPTALPSAGCVFRNPPGESAGRLLDACGMKGARVGGAQVSQMHANFICNVGAASAQDVMRLIEKMRTATHNGFGIDLELEIKHWAPASRVA